MTGKELEIDLGNVTDTPESRGLDVELGIIDFLERARLGLVLGRCSRRPIVGSVSCEAKRDVGGEREGRQKIPAGEREAEEPKPTWSQAGGASASMRFRSSRLWALLPAVQLWGSATQPCSTATW